MGGWMTYRFERVDGPTHELKTDIEAYHPQTIHQSPAWLAFVSRAQKGEPVVAALKDGRETVGYFTGVIVRKFGLRILGSPFPGWSTDYMGLSLAAGVPRPLAVQALIEFAFRELRCVHLEMMDRNLSLADVGTLDVRHKLYRSFEVNLTQDESDLFANMTSACRRCIRKAEKSGVTVEEAHDSEFPADYFAQLEDVFAKQSLVPTYSVERVRQLMSYLHPTGNLLLLRARDRNGRCIATGIFPHLNGVMYFWGGASWRQFQSLRPNEAVQWHAMKFGKTMKLRAYDMGGDGEYKRKYGGHEIEVPWVRKSKFMWVGYMRDMAERIHTARQQSLGQLNRLVPGRLETGETYAQLSQNEQ